MRIEQLQSSSANNRARVSAQVIWEDSAQAPLEVFFETESRFADSLCSDLNAFWVASLVPALWAGEKRIQVAGKICPQLLENLEKDGPGDTRNEAWGEVFMTRSRCPRTWAARVVFRGQRCPPVAARESAVPPAGARCPRWSLDSCIPCSASTSRPIWPSTWVPPTR